MAGTKIILVECGEQITSKSLLDIYADNPYCSEMIKLTKGGEPRYSVEGGLDIEYIDPVGLMRMHIRDELDKLARNVAKDIVRGFVKTLANEKRLSHPKMQPNIKRFKK